MTYKEIYIKTLVLYFLCLPLNIMNIGSVGSALKMIAILPIGISLVASQYYRIKRPEGYQMIFCLVALSSVFWSINQSESLSRTISYFLLLLLLFSGRKFIFNSEDIATIKRALSWSSRIMAAVVLVFADYYEGRLWLKNSIITEDPNYMCAYFSFGIIAALDVLLTEKENIKSKLISFIEIFIYVYIVFATGSRGGLISVSIGIGVFILFVGKFDAKKLFVIIGILILATYLLNNLPDVLAERFSVENVVESGGTGRFDLWKQAFDLFENSSVFRMLFGYGTGTARSCFVIFDYPIQNVVHNIFIEYLIEVGMVGVTIYTMSICWFVKYAYHLKNKIALGVIASMIALSMSTSVYTFKPYFNIMLFIIISSNVKSDDFVERECIEE